MPHVSPQQVNKRMLSKLYDHFFAAATSRRVPRKTHHLFFNELLTSTEKVMLGKRLAAIIALSQGTGTFRTGKALRLSTTTTGKFQQRLEAGDFRHIIKVCATERKGELTYFLEQLFKPLPRYGTSPSSVLKSE